MISEEILVTNNHCVPDQSVCDHTYIAVYNGHGYQKTKCQQVIHTARNGTSANDPNLSQDYTVLRVQAPVYTGHFSIARESFSTYHDGDKVKTWVVDHQDWYRSRITELECKFKQQRVRKSITLSHCPIIGGNSGAPVVNENNEIIGVIWGSGRRTFDANTNLSTRRAVSKAIGLATDLSFFIDSI